MNLSALVSAGFDIDALNHAEAVLERDFPQPIVRTLRHHAEHQHFGGRASAWRRR